MSDNGITDPALAELEGLVANVNTRTTEGGSQESTGDGEESTFSLVLREDGVPVLRQTYPSYADPETAQIIGERYFDQCWGLVRPFWVTDGDPTWFKYGVREIAKVEGEEGWTRTTKYDANGLTIVTGEDKGNLLAKAYMARLVMKLESNPQRYAEHMIYWFPKLVEQVEAFASYHVRKPGGRETKRGTGINLMGHGFDFKVMDYRYWDGIGRPTWVMLKIDPKEGLDDGRGTLAYDPMAGVARKRRNPGGRRYS